MNTGLGLRQTQQQKQVQTASAVQVMLSSIMELPLADLEQRVINEVEDNAALEISTDDESWDNNVSDHNDGSDEMGIRDSHTTEEDYDDCLTIDQVPEDMRERYNQEMRTGNASRSQYDGDTERQIADSGATSYDDIISQIGEHDLDEEEVRVMHYLIGSLDERGYLTKDTETLCDELTFEEYIYIDPAHLSRLVTLLQSFEPRGIGAHDLRECLLLQMECSPAERARLSLVKRLAHKVVRDMWDDLSRSAWHHIQDTLDVDDATIEEIQHVIRHLNPHPGSGLNESLQATAPTVIPDFHIYIDELGEPVVIQDHGSIPDLRVSSSFTATVEEYRNAMERAKAAGQPMKLSRSQEDAFNYASHKVESARTFIESIRRRRQTLQAVMEAIVRRQRDFFTSDDDEMLIRPMVLRDIAEAAGVDISTVSRAVNSKFLQTEHGTYSLKHFFGTEFVNTDGDSVSQRLAQNAINTIIEGEDPRHPYSDQQITDILATQGLTIARRTVAKYRERLGYPTSTMRRK